ncbi:MAG: MMPL family transporter, partial [Planctomycetales bacterium]|nr:MMPL family transporter [Planctomycetales bacterium]
AGMDAALRGDEPFISPWPAADERLAALGQLDQQRFLRDEGRVGFLLLRLAKDASRLDQTTESIVQLRAVLADVERAHPTVTLGLTGLPVMENDEMQTSQSDMLWSSVLSLVGVAILFVAGLGGLRHALLAVGVLAITMGWSFGYITLAVGHLNILSVAFGVILIGLGIDFGVHYVARYLQIRLREDDPDAALTQTARSIGPGVLTGAATTAIAFFTAYFTQFRGVAELGVVAGGGLLLCVAGALFVLPAAIKLFDGRHPLKRIPQPLAVERWVSPFIRWPRLTICVTVLATVAAGAGMSRLYYDHNLLNLQAEGLESVRLERMLFNETEQSVWFALSIASDREELLRRKQQFLQQESVDHVEEIASLLPPGDAHKQAIIARIGGRLARLPAAAPLISTPSPADVERSLSAALVSLPDLGAGRNEVREQLAAARAALTRLPPQDAFARISTYQQ